MSKTTIMGAISGLLGLAGTLFPEYKAVLDGASSFALILFGKFAADAVAAQK